MVAASIGKASTLPRSATDFNGSLLRWLGVTDLA